MSHGNVAYDVTINCSVRYVLFTWKNRVDNLRGVSHIGRVGSKSLFFSGFLLLR